MFLGMVCGLMKLRLIISEFCFKAMHRSKVPISVILSDGRSSVKARYLGRFGILCKRTG